eukprot:m.92942 g.92942  ORF g.92942 m.92942 type:complete len:507 (-) comp12992_c0_seq9:2286-3806(-)
MSDLTRLSEMDGVRPQQGEALVVDEDDAASATALTSAVVRGQTTSPPSPVSSTSSSTSGSSSAIPVPIVNPQLGDSLPRLLEETDTTSTVVQIQEEGESITIPVSFARASSPPPRRADSQPGPRTSHSAQQHALSQQQHQVHHPIHPHQPPSPLHHQQPPDQGQHQQHQQHRQQKVQEQRRGRGFGPSRQTFISPPSSDGEGEGASDSLTFTPSSRSMRKVGSPTKSARKCPTVPRSEGELSLVVNGRRFVVSASLFQSYPDTMLGRMFGSSAALTKPNDNGDYVLDYQVSHEAFAAVLKFYKTGQLKCPPTVSLSELRAVCDYFCIPFSHEHILCDDLGLFLHELANEGARSQFETFVHRSLLPAMAKCAAVGERKCHIVVLTEEDTVHWDDDLPPALGEQFAQIVHDSSLHRFLYSYENRVIAKQLLKDRGLKKIKLGIEGFPTYADKIKSNAQGEKLEVEYHYDQRPFLQLSWEKEEGRSRHVDFQFVRTNTSTSVLSTVMTA